MVKLLRSANINVINEFRLNFISCYLAKKIDNRKAKLLKKIRNSLLHYYGISASFDICYN